MRTFNKQQVKVYKNSGFITKAYKNKSEEELLQLQQEDKQLQLELQFQTLLTRAEAVLNRKTRKLNKDAESIKSTFNTIRSQQQLKKIKQAQPQPQVLQPVTVAEPLKDYKLLFKETINKEDWSQIELTVRESYLTELEQIKANQGGCSSCAKNALIRKYIKKIQALIDKNLV